MESVNSQQDLLNRMRALETKYSSKRVVRGLKRTHTLIAQLYSFTKIINIVVQSDPNIAALVWGPLALILEVHIVIDS
jgi:hypothetical protein